MTTALVTRNHEIALAGPVGSLDAYIQAVGAIPVLSKEDEQALAMRFHDEEDLDAARELVMAHLRFVVHIAKGYGPRRVGCRGGPGRRRADRASFIQVERVAGIVPAGEVEITVAVHVAQRHRARLVRR